MVLGELALAGHGANIIMADLGRTEKLDETLEDTPWGQLGIPCTIPCTFKGRSTRAPQWRDHLHLLPTTMTTKERRRHRPDILMVTESDLGPTIHIVEIKICRDTERGPQQGRAESQHLDLIELLEKQAHKVQLHTLLFGVGGTIYKDNHEHLQALGLTPDEARTCLTKIHLLMVQEVRDVLNTRYCIAKQREGCDPRGRRGQKRQLESSTAQYYHQARSKRARTGSTWVADHSRGCRGPGRKTVRRPTAPGRRRGKL